MNTIHWAGGAIGAQGVPLSLSDPCRILQLCGLGNLTNQIQPPLIKSELDHPPVVVAQSKGGVHFNLEEGFNDYDDEMRDTD